MVTGKDNEHSFHSKHKYNAVLAWLVMFWGLCMILNCSLQTSDILNKSHKYIENAALAQCRPVQGTAVKKI